MLQFQYTGASKASNSQADPVKSLGGYISSTIIPNFTLRNVFGDISQLTRNTNKSEMRVIAIQNTTNPTLTVLQAYFTLPVDINSVPNNICDYQIGYLVPTADACGDPYVELLPSIYAKPYTVTTYSAIGLMNALQLPNLNNGNYICLYLKRTLKASYIASQTPQQLVDILNGVVTLVTEEDISLTVQWV